jgi:RNA polymerase sigma factor (sigma-70 family)
MYRPSDDVELSPTEMDTARKVFIAGLWRLKYGAEFIYNHADDMLAKAHAEYVKCVKNGVDVENPIGWTVNCARLRTQSFIEAQKASPEVSTEKLLELVDREAPTIEQLAEDMHRAREIRRAVNSLRKQEQQIIALTYLEGMSVREAGRRLDWPEVTARRRFKSAMKHLEEFFEKRGITSSDELEIGLASFLASAYHSPGFLEVAFEKTGDAAAIAWEKAHDLSRRLFLGGGGDAAGVAASSGAGRAAGACATVAIACVVGAGASGVVGPGIGGGIGLVSGHHHAEARNVQSETTTAPPSLETSPVESTENETSSPTTTTSETETEGGTASAATTAAKQPAPIRVREQADAAARISSESSGREVQSAPSATATSSSAQSSSVGSSSSGSAQPAASSGSEKQAAQQFGLP